MTIQIPAWAVYLFAALWLAGKVVEWRLAYWQRRLADTKNRLAALDASPGEGE